jgi:hypothetical protein
MRSVARDGATRGAALKTSRGVGGLGKAQPQAVRAHGRRGSSAARARCGVGVGAA